MLALLAVNWTVVGVLLTALFTGALALITLLAFKEERFSSKKRRRIERRRAALRSLLGDQMDMGSEMLYADPPATPDAAVDWYDQTHTLISAALGSAEANIFKLGRIKDVHDRGIGHEYLMALDGALLNLGTLIERLEVIPIREDFEPEKWVPRNVA